MSKTPPTIQEELNATIAQAMYTFEGAKISVGDERERLIVECERLTARALELSHRVDNERHVGPIRHLGRCRRLLGGE